MLPSLLITLRECLEAALLLGLLLAVLARADDGPGRRWVWLRVAAAVAASLMAGAALFATGSELEGASEAAFEAGAMLAAAAVLAWMIVWMGRRAHALRGAIGGKVAAAAGSAAALYAGVMIWVLLRERRGTRSAGDSGALRPTDVAGRAPAGSSSRR